MFGDKKALFQKGEDGWAKTCLFTIKHLNTIFHNVQHYMKLTNQHAV